MEVTEETESSKDELASSFDLLNSDEHGVETEQSRLLPQEAGADAAKDDAKQQPRQPKLFVKIVSASYGPCEGRRLPTGELSSDQTSSIPYTRDVAPFLRALLLVQQQKEEAELYHPDAKENGGSFMDTTVSDSQTIQLNAIAGQGGMKRARIALLCGSRDSKNTNSHQMKSMNAVFGDPCPGTSKRLHVHYILREVGDKDDPVARAASSEAHHMSFAEHERVALERRVTFYQEDFVLKRAAARAAAKQALNDVAAATVGGGSGDEDEDETALLITARRMGRAQSIAEFTEDSVSRRVHGMSAASSLHSVDVSSPVPAPPPSPSRKWRLRSAASEIVLPMVMPFLEVRERVHCRFTRPFLRGILSSSHSSLQSLFLSGFEDLQQSDLHPAIPHLRKLRSLDISRCVQLDDGTLSLLSQHVNETLEVLYLKGLRKVTDAGIVSISQACSKLEVLEVSNIPITDQAGIAIGENLTKLRAIYMRDNYLLSNKSIDVITEKCTQLEQLTLWGCTRLQHLSFDRGNKPSVFTSGNLVLLNLWGCHSLKDDSAAALAGMSNLRSLIVSECHRLTDAFVTALGQHVSQLSHLYLRYCKRLTDVGVHAITQNMRDLYSLDLSFCTRVTASALFNLLEVRGNTLAELRLQSCRKLDITQDTIGLGGDGNAGRMILNALLSHGREGCVSVMDLRHCGGHPSASEGYPASEPFVRGMIGLGFEQKVPGYFERPARWNPKVERHLVDQFVASESD